MKGITKNLNQISTLLRELYLLIDAIGDEIVTIEDIDLTIDSICDIVYGMDDWKDENKNMFMENLEDLKNYWKDVKKGA